MLRTLVLCAVLLGALALAGAASIKGAPQLSAGLGAGIMYGGIGANVEYAATDQIVATAGLGLTGDYGFFVGGRYFFRAESPSARARLTLGYGHVKRAYLSLKDVDNSERLILGIGWSFADTRTGKGGLELDLTVDGTLSVGYRF
jgi:hypothetical protein